MARKAAPAFQAPPDDDEVRMPTPAAPASAPAAETVEAASGRTPRAVPEYRKGRKNLSVWIDEKAFNQFKSMVAAEGGTIQDYMVRMLNREFARKGRPEIAQ